MTSELVVLQISEREQTLVIKAFIKQQGIFYMHEIQYSYRLVKLVKLLKLCGRSPVSELEDRSLQYTFLILRMSSNQVKPEEELMDAWLDLYNPNTKIGRKDFSLCHTNFSNLHARKFRQHH